MNNHTEGNCCLFNEKEDICQLLTEKGVPATTEWRSLFLCLFAQQEADDLPSKQKNELKDLLSLLLITKDFSEASFQRALTTQKKILNAPCLEELYEALTESEKLLKEFRDITAKRTGQVEGLEKTTIHTIEHGQDHREMIEQLRAAFRAVVEIMKEDAEKLEKLSMTDQLTGLGNRRAFDLYLLRQIKRFHPGQVLSLMMADIDHFKRFNDTYGHRIGDQALNTVAKIIRNHMKKIEETYGKDHLAARYGGEEFAIIVPGMTMMEAVTEAEKIKHSIESYSFVIRNIHGRIIHREITLTVSIGVSEINPSWTESLAEQLLDAADQALYRAKHEGRNLVRY